MAATSFDLGKQAFAVNTQPLDVTTVVRDGEMCLHLTGTQFFEPMADDALAGARDLWNQELVSENQDVYRASFWQSTCSRPNLPGDPTAIRRGLDAKSNRRPI